MWRMPHMPAKPKTPVALDLDAARREVQHPDGYLVRFGGADLRLPAELPLDVFEPLLAPELDLLGAVSTILETAEESGDTGAIVGVLLTRPNLPAGLLAAVKDGVARLLGEEQAAVFAAARPSLQDYRRFITGVLRLYGVSLGEWLAPPETSETGGATSKETSGGTTG